MTGLEGVNTALTLRPPWAALVVAGPKHIENRGWPPPPWLIGKRIAIHAGLKVDEYGARQAAGIMAALARAGRINERDLKAPIPHADVRGAIIGTAVVTGFETDSSSLWFFGPFGWTLEDRRPLVEPIPCRGFQKLWALPRDLRQQVEALAS